MGQNNIYRSTIQSPAAFRTQAEKIEDLLRSRYGQWIPVYELADLALQYCARVNSIRKKLHAAGDSEEIPPPREERINGQLHTWYCIRRKERFRLAPGSAAQVPSNAAGSAPQAEPAAVPKPLKSWEEIDRERDERLSQPATFELAP